jgi:hypothetical protein
MKQHITVEQLKELSDKGFDNLNKWVFRNLTKDANKVPIKYLGKVEDYHLTTTEDEYLLSIGQMIEFLGEDWFYHLFNGGDCNSGDCGSVYKDYNGELCDALWYAVKEVLEKE